MLAYANYQNKQICWEIGSLWYRFVYRLALANHRAKQKAEQKPPFESRLKQRVDRSHIDQDTRDCADDPKDQNDPQGIFDGTVVAEQDRQADARIDQQSREKCSHRENVVHVKLGKNHRGRTVGDKSNQRGKKIADDGAVGKKQCKLFFANTVDDQI